MSISGNINSAFLYWYMIVFTFICINLFMLNEFNTQFETRNGPVSALIARLLILINTCDKGLRMGVWHTKPTSEQSSILNFPLPTSK